VQLAERGGGSPARPLVELAREARVSAGARDLRGLDQALLPDEPGDVGVYAAVGHNDFLYFYYSASFESAAAGYGTAGGVVGGVGQSSSSS
jgi:hypothetical protein